MSARPPGGVFGSDAKAPDGGDNRRCLVSLFDMQIFYADRFADTMVRIGMVHGQLFAASQFAGPEGVFASPAAPQREIMREALDDLVRDLDAMRLPFSRKAAERVRELILADNASGAVIRNEVNQFARRVKDEMETRRYLSLSDSEGRFFEPDAPLFGDEVRAKFQNAAFEIDEAGKCFAVGRYTASVFHLMRVMEVGIEGARRCLSIPDPVKPAQRNWGAILRAVKDELDTRKGAGWRSPGDQAFFDDVYVSLDAVRNVWRNATMHVENKYTEEEAEHIFGAVRGFMRKLAGRLDEQGLPYA
jgi:hypothetical protein